MPLAMILTTNDILPVFLLQPPHSFTSLLKMPSLFTFRKQRGLFLPLMYTLVVRTRGRALGV